MSVRAGRRLFAGGAFATALVVVAVLVLTAGPAKAKPFATIEVLAGSAEILPDGGSTFHPAQDGDVLRAGDTIRTGEPGRAQIEYFDGSVTRLDHGTEFTIEELASGPGPHKVIEGEHDTGNTFSRVQELTESESRFDVATPSAVASVRGTIFFTMIDEETGDSIVGVLEGAVAIKGDSAMVVIQAGEWVPIDSDGNVGVPAIITAEMLASDWLSFNRCILDHIVSCGEPPEEPPSAPPAEPPAPGLIAPATAASSGGAQDDQKGQPEGDGNGGNDEPPAGEPPPPPDQGGGGQPPAPPPPPPEPVGPPCDNPGNGEPCPDPGHAGSPPGQSGATPGQGGSNPGNPGGNGNGNGNGPPVDGD